MGPMSNSFELNIRFLVYFCCHFRFRERIFDQAVIFVFNGKDIDKAQSAFGESYNNPAFRKHG